MRVEINTPFVSRNRKIAQYLFFVSFGILIAGFFVTTWRPESLDNEIVQMLLPTVMLPVALISTLFSVYMTNNWLRKPHPEDAIAAGLKGVSSKSVLYHYYHRPARHVLIAPQGVYAIRTMFQSGHYEVDGDEWHTHGGVLSGITRFFRQDRIGNPTRDAIADALHIKSILEPIAPDVEVYPLIVFIDPKAQVDVNEPTVPVLYADEKKKPNLKSHLRKVAKEERPTLTDEQIDAFDEVTLP